MLYKEELNLKSKVRVCNNAVKTNKDIHALGLKHVCDFLTKAGFTIVEVNTDPKNHFQLLAKINEKSILVAVRSAYAPKVGTIDTSTLDKLKRESEKLNAEPHFAGLTLTPLEKKDIEGGSTTLGEEFKIIFNGLNAVGNSELLTANG